jgi:hypothetical protein
VRKAELGADVGCCPFRMGVCSSVDLSVGEREDGGCDVNVNGNRAKWIELLLM